MVPTGIVIVEPIDLVVKHSGLPLCICCVVLWLVVRLVRGVGEANPGNQKTTNVGVPDVGDPRPGSLRLC
jgi:hypothetical protein